MATAKLRKSRAIVPNRLSITVAEAAEAFGIIVAEAAEAFDLHFATASPGRANRSDAWQTGGPLALYACWLASHSQAFSLG
jgi:hypothetical protein